jgi:hypothetical protein
MCGVIRVRRRSGIMRVGIAAIISNPLRQMMKNNYYYFVVTTQLKKISSGVNLN